MTLEIQHGSSRYQYRISPTDPRVIERRQNKAHARWQPFRLCQDAQDARAKLLRLEKRGMGHKGENA